jgi:phosphoribosylpyrophosphate synthetase
LLEIASASSSTFEHRNGDGNGSPVMRSSTSTRKPRDHYESIAVTPMVVDREELCLVDDVVTKGATLLAAATRLREAYPNAKIVAFALVRKIVAFALVRTMGFVEDIERIVEPCIGTITRSGDEAVREP